MGKILEDSEIRTRLYDAIAGMDQWTRMELLKCLEKLVQDIDNDLVAALKRIRNNSKGFKPY